MSTALSKHSAPALQLRCCKASSAASRARDSDTRAWLFLPVLRVRLRGRQTSNQCKMDGLQFSFVMSAGSTAEEYFKIFEV